MSPFTSHFLEAQETHAAWEQALAHHCAMPSPQMVSFSGCKRTSQLEKRLYVYVWLYTYGGFLKWWYPTTMGVPTKMIFLGCFGGTTI